MKKIFTLLAVAFATLGASAQTLPGLDDIIKTQPEGVDFQIKIFLSFFGKSRKFNVMLQAVTGNVHDVVALWIKQKFFRLLQ